MAFLDKLKAGLLKTKKALFGGLDSLLKGFTKVDEDLLDELDEFDLLPDVEDDEDLGYYYVEEYGSIDIPEHLKNYFDYEAFGRDVRLENSCLFTSYGFLLDNR